MTYHLVPRAASITTRTEESIPVICLEDEYGGRSAICLDDSCYVLYNNVHDDGIYVAVNHWYNELFEIARHLPPPLEAKYMDPDEVHQIVAQKLDPPEPPKPETTPGLRWKHLRNSE